MERSSCLALTMLVVGLLGCGSEPLVPGFARTWRGSQSVLVVPASGSFGGGSLLYPSRSITITISGETATITPFCPDEWTPVTSITATGSGNSMSWTGGVGCWAVTLTDCDEVLPTYTSANAELSSDGSLMRLVSQGFGRGCSRDYTLSSAFDGR